MKKLLSIIVFILLFVCVFDPADKILHLKVPLFLFSILISFLITIQEKKSICVNGKLFFYFFIFSIILPILSFLVYLFFFRNQVNFLGLSSFKTYIFLSFIFVIYSAKIDAIKLLNSVLTILALVIIVFDFVVNLYSNVQELNVFGTRYLIYSISYSANWITKEPYYRIYFWTSPLLIFSVAYYAFISLRNKSKKYYILFFINVYGMYLSGSRGNQIMSIIAPLIVFYLYSYFSSRYNKRFIIGVSITIVPLMILMLLPYVTMLFSSHQASNAIKLSYVKDYMNLFFSDIKLFLLGQGIGTDFYVSIFNERMFFTELTYFELFRKFGLIFGSIYLLLLLYPCLVFFVLKDKISFLWLFAAYSFYLVMSFFNPFLFSSSGIIILSVVMVTIIRLEKTMSIYLGRFQIV